MWSRPCFLNQIAHLSEKHQFTCVTCVKQDSGFFICEAFRSKLFPSFVGQQVHRSPQHLLFLRMKSTSGTEGVAPPAPEGGSRSAVRSCATPRSRLRW